MKLRAVTFNKTPSVHAHVHTSLLKTRGRHIQPHQASAACFSHDATAPTLLRAVAPTRLRKLRHKQSANFENGAARQNAAQDAIGKKGA